MKSVGDKSKNVATVCVWEGEEEVARSVWLSLNPPHVLFKPKKKRICSLFFLVPLPLQHYSLEFKVFTNICTSFLLFVPGVWVHSKHRQF